MTQEIFPEIQAAAEALKTRIALTETEVAQMKDGIKAKRELLRSWRKQPMRTLNLEKALAAFGTTTGEATSTRPMAIIW